MNTPVNHEHTRPCKRLAHDHRVATLSIFSSSSLQAEKKAKKKQQKKKAAHSLATVRLDDNVGRQVIKSPDSSLWNHALPGLCAVAAFRLHHVGVS